MERTTTQSGAPFNLATSGVLPYPIAGLEVQPNDLELTGSSAYGYEPLIDVIATRYGVPGQCVVTAMGTSFANHLAMASLLDLGDEVLIEHPAYDPILSVAHYLGADVKRFHRRSEDGFQIDPYELRRLVTSRTRLIILTNLHNPSSVFTKEDALLQIQELARSVGARVTVGEVYLEWL